MLSIRNTLGFVLAMVAVAVTTSFVTVHMTKTNNATPKTQSQPPVGFGAKSTPIPHNAKLDAAALRDLRKFYPGISFGDINAAAGWVNVQANSSCDFYQTLHEVAGAENHFWLTGYRGEDVPQRRLDDNWAVIFPIRLDWDTPYGDYSPISAEILHEQIAQHC
jgi:hypothetical protein